MSQSPASAAKARRKNTSKACEECRRKRSKCDGERPSCSRCSNLRIDCRYTLKEDGRQPAPKSYVILLRKRIELLENALRMNGVDIASAVARAAAQSNAGVSKHYSPAQSRKSTSGDKIEPNSVEEDLSTAMKGAFIADESLTFDVDGEPRYFGSTSGRLELTRSKDSTSSPNAAATNTESPKSLAQKTSYGVALIAQQIDAIPLELKEHLMNLYFTWEHPWFRVIDEDLFRSSGQIDGRFYSPLLMCSVLAMGSRFSDRIELRADPENPDSAGKMFLEKAESLLLFDLKWPSITTIQSLCVLASFVIGSGSDATGWLYLGMANRLALDMGLNVDAQKLLDAGLITFEEVELRRQLYWSLYCNDKLSAAYTGRVCTMLDVQGNVKLPSCQQSHSHFGDAIKQNPLNQYPTYDENYEAFMKAFVRLCLILESILTTLYAPKSTPDREQASSFFESCLLDLRNWSYDLQPSLRIEKLKRDSKSPHVFILHMVYHTTFILVAKYFVIGSNARRLQKANTVKLDHNTDNVNSSSASRICYDSAREICAAAMKYRQTFGSFRQSPITATHCTLSAALVIFQKLTMSGEEGLSTRLSDQSNMELCLTTLEELSQAWHPARRLRLYLGKLIDSKDQENGNSKSQIEPSIRTTVQEEFGEDQDIPSSFDTAFKHNVRHIDTEILHQDTTAGDFASETLIQEPELSMDGFEFDFFGSNLAEDFNGIFHDMTLPMDYIKFDSFDV